MLRGWEPGIQKGQNLPQAGQTGLFAENGYMSSPIGKGAVASRVDVGGGLGDDCSLTCLYSATSVLVPERPRSEETAGGFSDDSASGFGPLSPQDARLRHGCLLHCLAEFMRLVNIVFQLLALSWPLFESGGS